jgi:hypothetical protein
MQIIDPNVAMTLLVVAVVAAAAAAALFVTTLVTVTRRERIARHETIPTYYGHLHFAR